jgi:hypothetical protein
MEGRARREFKLHVSLENVIGKRILEKEGWRDMTDDEQIKYLEEIKDALLETCRSQKSEIARAIRRMSPDNLPENIGIYRRVSKEGYCAGQDYTSELNFIKRRLRREC